MIPYKFDPCPISVIIKHPKLRKLYASSSIFLCFSVPIAHKVVQYNPKWTENFVLTDGLTYEATPMIYL